MPRKPLGQKTNSRKSRAAFRHAVLDRGMTPIPSENKWMMQVGWPTIVVTHEVIDAWATAQGDLKGTGIRLDQPDILVIDVDISDQEAFDEVMAALRLRWPGFFLGAIERSSGAVKRAFIARVSKPFRQARTRRFTTAHDLLKQLLDPGLTAEQRKAIRKTLNGQMVEAFGGLTHGRYFAIAGPHSPGRDYECLHGRSPATVDYADLPVLPIADVDEMLAMVEEILSRRMTAIPDSGQKPMGVVYDLVAGMTFVTKDGDEIELTELEGELEAGAENGRRGCMDWVSWSMSDSKANCNAFLAPHGRLMIQSYQDDQQHRWADEKPGAAYDAEELANALGGLGGGREPPSGGDPPPSGGGGGIERDEDPQQTYLNALAWLIANVAYQAQAFGGRGGVVSIHPDGEFRTAITVASLRGRMAGYSYAGKTKSGHKIFNPVDAWMVVPARVSVAGVRMRPELPRPLFDEDGLTFVNRYAPPAHPAEGGTILPFERRMQALVPDPDERAWVWNWMACLVQHPEWRMIALVMLAREMGAGRGLLAETLQLLLGERFVAGIPYASISGGSRFNAEVADKLLVYVNEAKAEAGGKYHGQAAAREALKVFIEPNHRIPFRVEPKGVDAYFTRASASTLILTNHVNGVPVEEGDRRAAIVTNGAQMSAAERDGYQRWMAKAENIGALWRSLAAHAVEQDRGVFDPYMAPAFRGRDLMIESGKSSIDMAWEEAVAAIGAAADLYTMTQIVRLARAKARTPGADFDELVVRHTINNGHRIGKKNGTNWLVTFMGQRERVYALDQGGERRYTPASREAILRQLGCAEKVVNAPGKAFNKLLRGVEGVEEEEE